MTTPIRVLCVFGKLDCGGAETMCMNLYRSIDRNKIQFDFVKHTTEKGAYEDEILTLGGKIFAVPSLTIKTYFKYKKWWNNHFADHPEHEIIHGHMFTTCSIYFKIAHKYGRITIAQAHSAGSDRNRDIKNPIHTIIRKYLRYKIINNSDYCLACSDLAGKYIFHSDNYQLLKNAINSKNYIYDFRLYNKYRKDLGISEKTKTIIVIGRFIQIKNPYGILEICKELLQKSTDWCLLWVGDGPMKEEIEKVINNSKLSQYIRILGIRKDIPNLLQASDIYLMPSIFEGLPVAAIEAQAAGLPCYCSNTISNEVNITGLCHFLPLNEWKMWANEIINDSSEKINTYEKIVKSGYDIKTTAKWIENFYLNIKK